MTRQTYVGLQVSAAFDEQLHALEPLRINRQPLAFSNPQPTAFPSHTLDVSPSVALSPLQA